MEANFSEPRSLFGGPSKAGAVSAFNSGSKKRKLMGLPFTYATSDSKPRVVEKSDKKDRFGLALETVQEKVGDHNKTIDVGALASKQRIFKTSTLQNDSGVKKVVGGAVHGVSRTIQRLPDKVEIPMKGSMNAICKDARLRQKQHGSGSCSLSRSELLQPINGAPVSSNCFSGSKNSQAQTSLEGKSSFTNVAQQILGAEGGQQYPIFDTAQINSKLRGGLYKSNQIGEGLQSAAAKFEAFLSAKKAGRNFEQ